MLRTHYRQPIDWTVRALEEAEATLDRWYEAVGDAEPAPDVDAAVLDALADDLNTPAALSELHKIAHGRRSGARRADLGVLKASANLLGLLQQTTNRTRQRRPSVWRMRRSTRALVEGLIRERAAARAAKNWAEFDRLRDRLAGLGVAIKDNKDGTTSWELKR